MKYPKKILLQVCSDCGNELGHFKGGAVGMWVGICDNCGKRKSVCSAPHDYGIYSTPEIEAADIEQRKI